MTIITPWYFIGKNLSDSSSDLSAVKSPEWVKDIGVDGFRCDVSELVPLDFWNEARNRLNKTKPVMMLCCPNIIYRVLVMWDKLHARTSTTRLPNIRI